MESGRSAFGAKEPIVPVPAPVGKSGVHRHCGKGGAGIAARARDAGIGRDTFVGRLETDHATIRAFPAPPRWFAHDGSDEAFPRTATLAVFDEPVTRQSHRALFLRACFERVGA